MKDILDKKIGTMFDFEVKQESTKPFSIKNKKIKRETNLSSLLQVASLTLLVGLSLVLVKFDKPTELDSSISQILSKENFETAARKGFDFLYLAMNN